MKILIDGMPRKLGGIGTLLMNLVHYNEKQGNRGKIIFEFLVPIGSAYIGVLESEGYKYFEVPKVLTKEYKRTICDIFKHNNYEYVWINNTSKINITLPRIAKKYGAKVIVHSHGVATEARGFKKIVFSIIEKVNTREYCNLIDIPFACSRASAEFFYPKELLENCIIVSNGIETENFLFNEDERIRIRSELGIDCNDILIGAVGRLTAVKNYVFLVDLLSELPNQYKVIVLGDGEDEEYLKDAIERNKVGNRFFLLGKKQSVSSYLSAMDIFAMPSLNEGMPFSLIEAQASGLKCIVSTGVSDEAKIIDSVFFVSLDNKQAWIEAIRDKTFLNSRRDELNSEIVEAGYSIETSYRTFLNAISKTKINGGYN